VFSNPVAASRFVDLGSGPGRCRIIPSATDLFPTSITPRLISANVQNCWDIRQANRAMVISTFQVAESMGFDGDFRQWEHLCASAIENCGPFSQPSGHQASTDCPRLRSIQGIHRRRSGLLGERDDNWVGRNPTGTPLAKSWIYSVTRMDTGFPPIALYAYTCMEQHENGSKIGS
jgi:hypothetical protein